MADLYCALYATPLASSSTPRLWVWVRKVLERWHESLAAGRRLRLRLWVWVRRVLERLVAPSVRQEPAYLVRSRTGAHAAVAWFAHEQRRLDAARKGGERR